jgi:hypothetical protein
MIGDNDARCIVVSMSEKVANVRGRKNRLMGRGSSRIEMNATIFRPTGGATATMHLASLSPIIGSLLLAWLPLSNAAAGEGPTFCQSVDKLKVTSPLTFIRPVPSFNLKWSPDICLCQADGDTNASAASITACRTNISSQ